MPLDIFCFKENELFGSEIPQSREDLEDILNHEIKIIVSLTPEIRYYKDELQLETSLEHYEILIPDGDVPKKKQVNRFLRILEYGKKNGKPVLVHCLAGCGRTGLMLALAERFVYGTLDGVEAIRVVRRVRPCAVENANQEQFIINFRNGR